MRIRNFSKIIYFLCLFISVFSFISLIFPVLIVETTISDIDREKNLFELGGLAVPLLIGNIIIFSILVLHKIKKLPRRISGIIDFVKNNDISRKVSIVILIVMFGTYIAFSIDEFEHEEFELGDYIAVKEFAENFDYKNSSITTIVRFSILNISYQVFENIKVLPFIASISLLLVTYFLTLELSRKRISSLIACGIVMQSNLFLIFDSTATYENFWTLFFFLSLYFIFKKPIGSPILFVLAMASKGLVAIYLPINFYVIITSKISKLKKKILLTIYGVIITGIGIAFLTDQIGFYALSNLDINRFVYSFNEFGNTMRFDGLILLILLPTIVVLGNRVKSFSDKINIVLIGIFFTLISQAMFHFITGISLQPYRLIPFVIFLAIGVGMVFSNSKTLDQK